MSWPAANSFQIWIESWRGFDKGRAGSYPVAVRLLQLAVTSVGQASLPVQPFRSRQLSRRSTAIMEMITIRPTAPRNGSASHDRFFPFLCRHRDAAMSANAPAAVANVAGSGTAVNVYLCPKAISVSP